MANWYNYINFADEWDSREWPLYDKRKSMALPALLIFPLTLLNIDKMNQTEIWKPVVGLEDYYMISNIGRIKSVERIVVHSDGRKRNIGGKILKTRINNNGYECVRISCNRQKRMLNIHRMVALAFIPNIENKPYIYTKFSLLGISENDIKDFIECLKTFIEENNIKYFMQSTLLKAGFKHKLNDLFIDNETLFSSLVRYGLDGYIGTIFGTVHSLIFAKRGEVREMIVSNYVKQFVSFNGIAFKDIIKAVKDDCGVQIYNYDLVTYLSKFDEFYVKKEKKRVLIVAK